MMKQLLKFQTAFKVMQDNVILYDPPSPFFAYLQTADFHYGKYIYD